MGSPEKGFQTVGHEEPLESELLDSFTGFGN